MTQPNIIPQKLRHQPPLCALSPQRQGLHQQQEVREVRFVSWRAGFVEHLLQLLTEDEAKLGDSYAMGKRDKKGENGWNAGKRLEKWGEEQSKHVLQRCFLGQRMCSNQDQTRRLRLNKGDSD